MTNNTRRVDNLATTIDFSRLDCSEMSAALAHQPYPQVDSFLKEHNYKLWLRASALARGMLDTLAKCVKAESASIVRLTVANHTDVSVTLIRHEVVAILRAQGFHAYSQGDQIFLAIRSGK